MSQILHNPAYMLIEDRLDAVGQKYRVQRIVRGAMLWLAGALATSFAAALAAHLIGQGAWARGVLASWLAWLLVSAALWILRPLLIRPDLLKVARLVETRVAGLHNGLTNGLLLATRDDIAASPWLPQIYDEILINSRSKPLEGAVKIRDLQPLAIRLLFVAVPLAVVMLLLPRPFAHGWQQMLNPGGFVPQTGSARILEVKPGDVTLVTGRPLEITILAEAPDTKNTPAAKLIFEHAPDAPGTKTGGAEVSLSADMAGAVGGAPLRYSYRADHVDSTTRYRVEVGGTQSPWYTVTVVKQVKLQELLLKTTPPSYTRQPQQTLTLTADDLAKSPISAPIGSRVDLTATVDVSVGGAMLQAGEGTVQPTEASLGGRRFSASLIVADETPVELLLTEGAGQVIAKVPDPPLLIHCLKDAAPTIDMKWPTQDVSVAPQQELKVTAVIKDDYGVGLSRVLVSREAPTSAPATQGTTRESEGGAALAVANEKTYPDGTTAMELSFVLNVSPELRKHGNSIRVQVEVTDNRDLRSVRFPTATAASRAATGASADADPSAAFGPQTTRSSIYEIKFRDPEQIAREQKQEADKLRERLLELLKAQQSLHAQAAAGKPQDSELTRQVGAGQAKLRESLQQTAETFTFEENDKIIQKTLLMLAYNPAREAVELCASMLTEPVIRQRVKLSGELQSRQRRIISTLESLLALLRAAPDPATQPSQPGGDIPNKAEAYKKLNEALNAFIKEEQRILDQTASLAKKPVDDWDDADKKKLDELKLAQEKLDSFMQEKIADFSKLAEQDMSNASLLKELMEVYSETTMARDALKAKAVETAVTLEDSGLELAKEINTNIEKWLVNNPDRTKFAMEDPVGKTDTPMAELPKELEDMVGELMEQQEDLFEDMEDTNANWTDSGDKGIGWDAADGPVANMTAKGVTGNQLPNNNEMGGRSGEGRSGKSQGEMVEETNSGKGGRDTPTRLDPTPFSKGQVKNESKDPTGGATGGGKISGAGGAGLEGPVPPQIQQQMQRLAQKQAELRNKAERLDLKYHLGKYDNFKLLQSTALMRRIESDLKANRYNNAMRRKDVTIDSLSTSRLLLGGEVHVQQDTSPRTSQKLKEQINDAMKGQLPPAWADALKEYYKKLAQE